MADFSDPVGGGSANTDRADAFGEELLAYLEHGDPMEIVEREDGYITAGPHVPRYFSRYHDWPGFEREAIRYAHGRVIDVGCGAGRVSLYLQQNRLRVTGIDISPGALEVCRRRGVDDVRLLSFSSIDEGLGCVDTWILYGNNVGLFQSRSEAKRLLGIMHSLSSSDTLILAESTDISGRTEEHHRVYREWNERRGRMPGQLRVRIRHGRYASPWFDYLYASRTELEDLLSETGWSAVRYTNGPYGEYVAVIRRLQP